MFDEGTLPLPNASYPIWIELYTRRTYKDVSPCIKSTIDKSRNDYIMEKITEPQVLRMERTDEEKRRRKSHGDKGAKFSAAKELKPRADGISNTVTTNQKDNMLIEPIQAKVLQAGNLIEGGKFNNPQRGRVYSTKGISPTIQTYQGGGLQPKITQDTFRIRRLTPLEVGRLMDMDDADIRKMQAAGISETQLFKMFGNSIVTNVLYHIFRKMFIETENENRQLTLF